MPGPEDRYPIVFTQRRILPVAVAFALVGAAFTPGVWVRLVCAAFALAGAGIAWWLWRARPAVVVDDSGYVVEEHGREKLRVAWSEVVKVRADAEEKAAYVDCGDRARNLLIPPRRGYGFRFERSDALYARVLGAVPDKVVLVPRLDAPAAPPIPDHPPKT